MSSKQSHTHHKAYMIAQQQAKQVRRRSSSHGVRPSMHRAASHLGGRGLAQPGQAVIEEEYGDSDDADTETDEEPETAKRSILSRTGMGSGKHAHADRASPLKRKRAMSMSELIEFPDSPPASDGESATTGSQAGYHFDDIAALDVSEDEMDMERVEAAELIHDREVEDMRGHKFHVMDDDKPFAYAFDGDEPETNSPSEQGSRSEEYWLEDFDALLNGPSLFEIDASNSANNRMLEPSEDSLLEQEFFVQYVSSSDDGDNGQDGEDEDDSDDEEDDRIGLDCFFANGESDSENEMELEAMAQQALAEEELAQAFYLSSQVPDVPDQEEYDSDGSTTDDEAPELLLERSKSKSNFATPARALVKSTLTSCLKQASFTDSQTPSKQTGGYMLTSPNELTTPNQAPLLGTWTRDSRKAVAVIDGSQVNSPAHTPPLPKATPILTAPNAKITPAAALAAATQASFAASSNTKRVKAYRRSDAMTAAMTSLDDIMYTNDFLVQDDDDLEQGETSFDARPPIAAPGAFRRHQQSRANVHKEDSLKDEWFMLTSKNKASRDTRKLAAVPVLGLGTESLSRREKRRRKKLKTATASGGLSRHGGSTLSLDDDYSAGDDDVFGVERAGLGMGPPLESLFSF